jgi:hypothetical protein
MVSVLFMLDMKMSKAYGVDLNVVVDILGLDSQEERSEPLKGTEISADPEEVDLPQARATLGVVHPVPDTLQNRGEWRDTNTGTDQYGNFELEHILGCRTKWTIDVHSGQNLAECNLFTASTFFASFLVGLSPFEIATKCLSDRAGKVADHTHVYRNVVLFGCARKGEGMVLPDRDFRATHENVLFTLVLSHLQVVTIAYLTSTGVGVLLLDLNLANVAGMLNDLGDVRLVASTDLTRNTLTEVGESTVHPVLPENTNAIAEGCKVGLDHAEGSVDGPEDEEDDEEVMCVPEALEVGSSCILSSCKCDRIQSDEHHVSTPARTSSKVGENKAHESEVVAGREPCKVVPMGNCVEPGKEDDRPGNQLVEGDVLVEGNDIVQRCATSHGD